MAIQRPGTVGLAGQRVDDSRCSRIRQCHTERTGGALTAVLVTFVIARAQAAGSGSITVEWDLSTDPQVVGYIIDYGESPGGYTAQLDAGYATTSTLWDLEVGQTYHIAVRGYTATGTVE